MRFFTRYLNEAIRGRVRMFLQRRTARLGSTTRLSKVCGRAFITASTEAALSKVTKPKPRERPSRSRRIIASLQKNRLSQFTNQRSFLQDSTKLCPIFTEGTLFDTIRETADEHFAFLFGFEFVRIAFYCFVVGHGRKETRRLCFYKRTTYRSFSSRASSSSFKQAD